MTTEAPARPPLPVRLTALTNMLTTNGWTYRVKHAVDMCEAPYVDVEAIHPDAPGDHLHVTWHTRGTGTYRLFSVTVGDRHVSYAAALNHANRNQTNR